MPPRVMSVVGVRPQFVKHAPVSRALAGRADEVVVHTGQHYDPRLSKLFFEELGLPTPAHYLKVGSGSHAEQTGWTAERLEALVEAVRPDYVLVFGDTNTTLGAALAVAKLDVALGHVEAGVRAGLRANPEEQNRLLVDHVSDQLFAPTRVAVEHLEREAVWGEVHLTGDVMVDALQYFLERAPAQHPAARLGLEPGTYVLATIHRAENTGDPAALAEVVRALLGLEAPVILPCHPRTQKALVEAGLWEALARAPAVHLEPPAGYLEMLVFERDALRILTDSGGVQKEAYLLGTPCVTVFPSTSWPETLAGGWNRLTKPVAQDIVAGLEAPAPTANRGAPYGDGQAAVKIAQLIHEYS